MKTLLTLTVLALSISFTASAKETTTAELREIKAPVFTFGSPEEINEPEIAELKKMIVVKAPEFVWGSPAEAGLISQPSTTQPAAKARVAAPEFVWGCPDDLNSNELQSLKIEVPAFVWGSPDEAFEL